MRLALDDLEEARANPEEFRKKVETGQEGFMRPGRHAIMQNALQRWHKGEITIDQARTEMISKCEQRFKAQEGLKAVTRHFDQYVVRYQGLDNETPLVRMRVSVPLPTGADPRFKITGNVRRLDRSADGMYTAWLWEKTQADWKTQLRLPLIQAALAARLNVDIEEIEVGIYCFQDNTNQTFSFTQTDVDNARHELETLLISLAPLVEQESLPAQTILDL